jgi:epoxyqueuosine reductase
MASILNSPEFQQRIIDLGVSHWGSSPLSQPLTFDFFSRWLDQSYHGEMKYLEESKELRLNPQNLKKGVKSALVFAFPYIPHPEPHPEISNSSLRVASYAQGYDYHFWMKERLRQLIEFLKTLYPTEEFFEFTDSAPILERDLARKANLGWVGKNTCLIHPQKGSLFLLGEILTTFAVEEPSELTPDFCGKCRRCIDICPTQALNEKKELDARKCISYWTIESRRVPPPSLRENFGDHFFGCDLCQTICPWNQKAHGKNLLIDLHRQSANHSALTEELRFFLTASGKQIQKKITGTPLLRAGPFGLRRNALVVIGNLQLEELTTEVRAFLQDPKLGELADWCLQKINSVKS